MNDTKKLEEAIKTSGYKKSFLAKSIGVSRQHLDKCIKNDGAEFKISQVQTLCDLLRLGPAEKEAIFFASVGA